jgi:RNA polymerase sigma-70 factor, ECF subfamily
MASSFQGVITNAGVFVPAKVKNRADYQEIYNEHCHRIYSLAFWITDHEPGAEQLSGNTFLRAFAWHYRPEAEQVDQAFVAEIRELMPVGELVLRNNAAPGISSVRARMKRIHLERAVVQLPVTEKLIFLFHDVEGYEHARIASLLGISENESAFGLHQARVFIREQVARMQN